VNYLRFFLANTKSDYSERDINLPCFSEVALGVPFQSLIEKKLRIGITASDGVLASKPNTVTL